jgi:N-acetylglucosaminyl-diphospho-decaprenol L-rhamnosyltransferase
LAPAVDLIVVNYNAGTAIAGCLDAAAADLGGVDWQGIVVDNASADGSADALERGRPRVRVVRNAVNAGFGAAINQAARMSDAPLLWLLNPDASVRPGTFAALKAVLDAHATCAIAAPRLVNADGSTQESARGEPTPWTGLFGRHGLLTKLFPNSAMARRNLQAAALVAQGVDSAAVDWVMGAAMLVRRQAFDLAGGFDERYFLYWEDADLCHRLRDKGWTTRYVPGAVVDHPGGRSSRTAYALATREFHRSAYRYYATHVVPSPWHPLRWFARAALTARAWLRIAVQAIARP